MTHHSSHLHHPAPAGLCCWLQVPGKRFGPVRISAIRDEHPGLDVGDVIFEVDGRYLLEASFAEAVGAIKEAGEFATFVVADAQEIDAAETTDARTVQAMAQAVRGLPSLCGCGARVRGAAVALCCRPPRARGCSSARHADEWR